MEVVAEKVKDQKGFTLIESLIVLAILMAIISVTVPLQSKTVLTLNENNFFEQFERDILYMQNTAITSGKMIMLVINPSDYTYELRESGFNKLLVKRTFPSYVKIQLNTFKIPFYYYPTGVPNQPGSFNVSINESLYKVTFPFGKGRYYVTKQK